MVRKFSSDVGLSHFFSWIDSELSLIIFIFFSQAILDSGKIDEAKAFGTFSTF